MLKKRSEDFQNLLDCVKSYGYAVMQVRKRIFCLAPGSETIFVLRQLQREGYWEMNMVDRFMWERYGAMGYPIRPYISVPELLEFLYTYAAGQELIRQGMIVADAKGIFEKNNFEPPLERLQRKLKDMYMRHDVLFCNAYYTDKDTKQAQADLRAKLLDPESEHNKMRENSTPILETKRKRGRPKGGKQIQ